MVGRYGWLEEVYKSWQGQSKCHEDQEIFSFGEEYDAEGTDEHGWEQSVSEKNIIEAKQTSEE